MRKWLLAVSVFMFLSAGPAELQAPRPDCTEDMACWNCDTMGNKQCGPARA